MIFPPSLYLLILAGVTIATLTGENGLLSKAQIAKERNQEAEDDEKDKLSSYEDEIDNYGTWERTGEEGTITISEEAWNKVEKVDNIPMSANLAYGNTVLNYDFTKYKRVGCYVNAAYAANMILEIDLSTLNASTIVNGTADMYLGSTTGSRYTNNQDNLVFMCVMTVNSAKNYLTLNKLGFINGTTYNNRMAETSNSAAFFVYKVEGIY